MASELIAWLQLFKFSGVFFRFSIEVCSELMNTYAEIEAYILTTSAQNTVSTFNDMGREVNGMDIPEHL